MHLSRDIRLTKVTLVLRQLSSLLLEKGNDGISRWECFAPTKKKDASGLLGTLRPLFRTLNRL